MHTILLAVERAESFLIYLSRAGQSQSIQIILPKVYLGKNGANYLWFLSQSCPRIAQNA